MYLVIFHLRMLSRTCCLQAFKMPNCKKFYRPKTNLPRMACVLIIEVDKSDIDSIYSRWCISIQGRMAVSIQTDSVYGLQRKW